MQVCKARQAKFIASMHVVMARIRLGKGGALTSIRSYRFGTDADNVALMRQEFRNIGVVARPVTTILAHVEKPIGIIAG